MELLAGLVARHHANNGKRLPLQDHTEMSCVRCGHKRESRYGLCRICRFVGFPLELFWERLRMRWFKKKRH